MIILILKAGEARIQLILIFFLNSASMGTRIIMFSFPEIKYMGHSENNFFSKLFFKEKNKQVPLKILRKTS